MKREICAGFIATFAVLVFGGQRSNALVVEAPDVTTVTSVVASAGDAAERVVDSVAGAAQATAPAADEVFAGPPEKPKGVSAATYRHFERLVTSDPEDIDVAVPVTTADAFWADGGVPGVSPYGFGRLDVSGVPQEARLIR